MRIKIKVKPNSRKQELEKIQDGEYLVYLKSLPEKNKANSELIKLLKKEFQKDIKIVSGLSFRRKLIEIKDGD